MLYLLFDVLSVLLIFVFIDGFNHFRFETVRE